MFGLLRTIVLCFCGTEEDRNFRVPTILNWSTSFKKYWDEGEYFFPQFWQWAGTTEWIHHLGHLSNIPIRLHKKLMLQSSNQVLTCPWNFTNSLPIDYPHRNWNRSNDGLFKMLFVALLRSDKIVNITERENHCLLACFPASEKKM